LEQQESSKESQLLAYLDQQNKMIQSIAERLNEEKRREEHEKVRGLLTIEKDGEGVAAAEGDGCIEEDVVQETGSAGQQLAS
jgi:hypothetical protein